MIKKYKVKTISCMIVVGLITCMTACGSADVDVSSASSGESDEMVITDDSQSVQEEILTQSADIEKSNDDLSEGTSESKNLEDDALQNSSDQMQDDQSSDGSASGNEQEHDKQVIENDTNQDNTQSGAENESSDSNPEEDTREEWEIQLCESALRYYEVIYNYRPQFAVVDHIEGDTVYIHLYDDMEDHTATLEWYTVDRNTLEGVDVLGNPVDLNQQ